MGQRQFGSARFRRRRRTLPVLVALAAATIGCRPTPPPAALPNDLAATAGTIVKGELLVELDAGKALWRPAADDGPAIEVAAFGERGKAPQIPGPLIRVPAGATVRVRLRNLLGDTLRVTGLVDPRLLDTVVVAPGDSTVTRFRATRPGLYGYQGATRRNDRFDSRGHGEQLVGVIAVDSANAPRDRLMAITIWAGPIPYQGIDSLILIASNGRIWPHTSRIGLAVRDTAHWRVINLSGAVHPMHLHGAYFRVDARGNLQGDTAYSLAARRLAVTETLEANETMSIAWSPERPGRWLFHCHDAFHIDPSQIDDLAAASAIWNAELRGRSSPPGPPPPPASGHTGRGHGMAGLIVGVEVTGDEPDGPSVDPRRIDLTVQQRPRVYGDTAGIGFVAVRPGAVPADSIAIPGPPLVLERGQPVAITVHNRLPTPTSIHWHGLELTSYFDGVSGWSGTASHPAPSIAPGDSFVARFTPPRAGTFIYHSHFSEVRQLSLGLYGPLLVVEPGRRFDPDRDRVMLFAQAGNDDSAAVVLHGAEAPLPRGVPVRLRFIDITAGDGVDLEMVQGGRPMTWRRLAKDGADLPVPVRGPARLRFQPGETIDVEVIPGEGPITIRVKSFNDFDVVVPVR